MFATLALSDQYLLRIFCVDNERAGTILLKDASLIEQGDNCETQPERTAILDLQGDVVLDFGTDWCGYCLTAAPLIQQALSNMPNLKHVKVEDGPGRPLGRSFQVKLWPTLIFLKDGKEQERLVRPTDAASIQTALDSLTV